MHSYDYVVVGGGSSGCVLAAELSRDPTHRVLLLESGQRAEQNPETLLADGYKDAFRNDDVMWDRLSTPQAGCANKRLFMGTGRGMGGSGSVNGMVYTRGDVADFATWPEGWRWNDVLPAFEAVESQLRLHRHDKTQWTEASIAAAIEAGFWHSDDLNDGNLGGAFGYEWMNFEGDKRRSSYASFIKDVVDARPNLHVQTGAHTRRVRLDSQRRVTGVEYEQDGVVHVAEVRHEAILCAGALETPKLMMLSGIGPGGHLRSHGIAVAHDSAEVGQGFHDHPNVTLFFQGHGDVDCFYPQLYGFHRANPKSDLPEGQPDSCYVMYPARSSLHEALVRLLPSLVLPQGLYDKHRAQSLVRSGVDLVFRSDWLRAFIRRIYGVVVILGKPKSRGEVKLDIANARATPHIDPAYFSDPEDMQTMLRAVDRARRIARGQGLAQWGNRELWPGVLGRNEMQVESWIRNNAMTTYHFAGTCRMGTDEASVVDTQLRVRGIEGLRVADASVVPWTPVSAMNAPSMMVGFRAAELIRESRRSSEPVKKVKRPARQTRNRAVGTAP